LRLADDSGLIIVGVIARFHLKGVNNPLIVKRYFIPVIVSSYPIKSIPHADGFVLNLLDGLRYLYFAEHSLAFQKAIMRHFIVSAVIHSSRGRVVRFRPLNRILPDTDANKLSINPSGMAFSSSNILTFMDSDTQSVVCKTYKDMRGESGRKGKVWAPNHEAQRYKNLAAANYPNIPKLLGVAAYKLPDDHPIPLILLTETIINDGQVGEVFGAGLVRLLDALQEIGPVNTLREYEPLVKGMRIFARQVLKTVVRMHAAFISSRQKGFSAEPAACDDLAFRSKTVLNHFVQAMAAIKKRSQARPEATTLRELSGTLAELGPAVKNAALDMDSATGPIAQTIFSLRDLEGIIMKAQVHGDLHLDQGLIKSVRSSSTIATLLDTIASGNAEQIQHQSAQIAARIRWIDFEGPPAKELVGSNHDFRESPLVDLAGLVQSLLYIANTKLYEYLGLNYQNPADHENQRKASLVLLGQLTPDRAGIAGLDKKLMEVLSLWLNDMTASFIEGYLDEIESQGLQNILLSSWNRDVAGALANYWILARAIHEFRYETYGRDWGWEAIAGARIIQLVKGGNIAGRLNKAVTLA
jgi:predicted trehalose synthase